MTLIGANARRVRQWGPALSILVLVGCTATTASPTTSPSAPTFDAAGAAAREASSPNVEFDTGHTVHFTAQGVLPHSLAAACCSPITFKNSTTSPVTVVFDHQPVQSPAIAAGATWQWIPRNPQSVTFHTSDDINTRGHIQVEGGN